MKKRAFSDYDSSRQVRQPKSNHVPIQGEGQGIKTFLRVDKGIAAITRFKP